MNIKPFVNEFQLQLLPVDRCIGTIKTKIGYRLDGVAADGLIVES